jgi:Domain of unknown function (DUF4091)
MKKTIFIFAVFSFFHGIVLGQFQAGQIDLAKVPSPIRHYQPEYTFDVTTDPARWASERPGLHVSFGSTDETYFRSEVPDLKKETLSWRGTGWKGERVNAMILIWSKDTLSDVNLTINDLVDSKGRGIRKNDMKLNLIRYVISNYPYNAKDVTCGVSPYKSVYLMPDRFEEFRRFDLPGRTVRPVWLSIEIPIEAAPGSYHGAVQVKSGNATASLGLDLEVQNLTLPKPHEWKYRLDLWQNPWVIARHYGLKPWSEEHKILLKKHLKLYADAGGKYITTYCVHSPWADNSYTIEEEMVKWTKKKNGGWQFDYDIFDQYVELAMEAGIDKAITIYTPVPWEFRFRYMDESTGNYVYESWPPDSDKFKAIWNIFLTDLKTHLDKKGWFDKTYLGINENAMEQTMAAIKVIKAHSNKWKITYAGDWHPELATLLNDYCFLYGKESGISDVKKRSAAGFTTTYYVCCNPPKPNNFIFSPPVEGRWISWYSAAHGYDGFLRWAYDAWPADPARDSRHEFWPSGDCFLVYPAANSSIRFEKLREGIVDYEKIRIIRELVSKSQDANLMNLMKQFEEHLKVFVDEHDFNTEKITADVIKGKNMVEEISGKLAMKNIL